MADGSLSQAVAADREEVRRLFGLMFDPPFHMLSREVFIEAFRTRDGKAYKEAEAEAAHKAFVQDPLTCPQHVIDFCRATLKV